MSHFPDLPSVHSLSVLVTGAAQGMGAIFARRAAQDGASRIILWDLDAAKLAALGAELSGRYPALEVVQQVVDLGDEAEIKQGAAQVLAGGAPHVLINNAGVVTGKPFMEHDPLQVQRIMQINTLAPMQLTLCLLPAMVARNEPARILTIASAAALVSNPNMSVYAASKAAVFSWSDSLRLELARANHGHVKVTTFCPTYVNTGMFAGARKMLLTPIMDARSVTDRAWRAMLHGTPIVLMPWTSKLGQVLRGVLPRAAWDFLAERVLGIYHSMDQFTGRESAEKH